MSSSDFGDVPVDWWDRDWAYRRELVLDTGSPSESMDAFVLLVRLPPDILTQSAIAPGGDDLRFVDRTNTELDYEVERFGPEATLWVRIPTIEAGVPSQSIYMYYGHGGAVPATNPSAVWGDPYAAVYHLSDAADATGRAGYGQITDADFGAGWIADGLVLGGATDSHLLLPAADGLQGLFSAGGTIAALIRLESFGESAQGRIVDKALNAGSSQGWILNVDDAMAQDEPTRTIRFVRSHDDGQAPVDRSVWKSQTGSVALDTWHFVVLTYDEQVGDARIYVDGVDRTEFFDESNLEPVEPEAMIGLRVGRGAGELRYFHGVIDELRFARIVRSPTWIVLQNRSVRDDMVTIGPQERR